MSSSRTPSFTLIELLVVISIITLIASVIFASLNKSRIAARDTRRISDLQEFRKAILLASDSNLSLGSASTVYTSLSDSSATCASYALPGLPAGWHYHCSSAPTKNDGTGWLPIPFSQTSPPFLSTLSTDPLNTGTPSAPYYYTYVYDPSTQNWNLNATMENPAQGVGTIAAKDGGISMVKYELGTDPTYGPSINNGLPASLSQGLVGYWPMDEGGGAIAYDVSGNNNNGTLMNGAAWGVGKVGGGALYLDGLHGWGSGVDIPDAPSLRLSSDMTLAVWFNAAVFANNYDSRPLIGKVPYQPNYHFYIATSVGQPYVAAYVWQGGIPQVTYTPVNVYTTNTWYHAVFTKSGSTGRMYLNGSLVGTRNGLATAVDATGNDLVRIGEADGWARNFIGLLDDVRIYNRALSDAEVQQLYDAEK